MPKPPSNKKTTSISIDIDNYLKVVQNEVNLSHEVNEYLTTKFSYLQTDEAQIEKEIEEINKAQIEAERHKTQLQTKLNIIRREKEAEETKKRQQKMDAIKASGVLLEGE